MNVKYIGIARTNDPSNQSHTKKNPVKRKSKNKQQQPPRAAELEKRKKKSARKKKLYGKTSKIDVNFVFFLFIHLVYIF